MDATQGECRDPDERAQTHGNPDRPARGPIRTFPTRVARVGRITPRMREITVAGGLEGFTPLGPDQFVYVLAPPRGRRELTIDASFAWDQVERMPESERPIGAYYTVRRWRPDVGEIDLWVVLHGEEGDGSWWAQHARPGDAVALWGPRSLYHRPEGVAEHVLIGDETAVPAMATILESLGSHERARALCLGQNETDRIELTSPAALQQAWYACGDDGRSRALEDALRTLPLSPSTCVWGAGESRVMQALRKLLRRERHVPAERVSLTGYWRHAR